MEYMPKAMNKAPKSAGNKAKPRMGAAMGQGNGKGGYNANAVNRASRECGMPAPKYYQQGGVPAGRK